MNQIANQRFSSTFERIESACRHSGRNFDRVRMLAASKGQSAAALRELHALGQRAFGENYVDEAIGKIDALTGLDLEWHYIGPIQSNKTRLIARHFDWVQSVDRAKIITRLDAQRPDELAVLQVLVQVNLDGEAQKAGCPPQQIHALAEQIAACQRLELRGLMAIPAARENYADQRAVFARLRALFDKLKRQFPQMDTLSAGMSADLEAAIAEGSTMLRIGTALFGPRS